MLNFGKSFAQKLTSDWNVTFRDRTRLTRSEMSEVSPVTTGRSERVEKSTFQSPATVETTVIELLGDVGAGKTTFTRGLAQGLGVKEPITSPSFTISKSYALPNSNGRLIHYDFYRLPNPGLMLDDLRDNLENPENIIIVEWSDSVKNILPKNHIKLFINKLDDGSREIKVKDNRNNAFRDRTRLTRSGMSEASPVTTGRSERVEKGVIRLSMYLDTSTPETFLRLNDKEYKYTFANDLAEKLLQFIHDKLQEDNKTWQDITEITFMSGPGSFTGLRIGATVVNTLASELNIPLYDHHDKQHQIILPDYGRPANISKPRK